MQDDRQFEPSQSRKKQDKAVLKKGFGAIASSLNYLGNALEVSLVYILLSSVNLHLPVLHLRFWLVSTPNISFNFILKDKLFE